MYSIMILKRIGAMVFMWEVLFFRYTPMVLAVAEFNRVFNLYNSWCINERLSWHCRRSDRLLSAIIVAIAGLVCCGKLIQRLHQSAHQDHLTSLWNGRYFHSELTKEIARLRRTQSTSCLALIDNGGNLKKLMILMDMS